jgi:hypothetical protein
MANIPKTKELSTPFVSLEKAATITGLSQYYLRQGCRNGTTPHIRCGTSYKINLPKLLDELGVPYERVKF